VRQDTIDQHTLTARTCATAGVSTPHRTHGTASPARADTALR
jgi:hypothetical protein